MQAKNQMDQSGPIIRLDSVGKVFFTDEVETHALNQVNLEIESGEYVAISGPSGMVDWCRPFSIMNLVLVPELRAWVAGR